MPSYHGDERSVIIHVDDVGMCHGANVAFEELSRLGSVSSGSVMAPCPWFTEAVAMAARGDLDLGVHLTLTSEWAYYRWAPISTTSRHSGLIDETGYFWRRLPMLAAHVVPEAAEEEMRAQIDRVLSAGLDVTHLDTHMGAALLPSLVDIYLRLGREYRLPVLWPRNLSDYFSVLEFDRIVLEDYEKHLARLELENRPLVDHFRMTPGVPSVESDLTYRRLIADLPAGLTLLAVHPCRGGEIEAIVPDKAHFRTDEYRLFTDPSFIDFMAQQEIQILGFRPLRDRLRGQENKDG